MARWSASDDVGELVLDRLERTDRHVELLALLGVLERHVEDAPGGADHFCREQRVGAIAPRVQRGAVERHNVYVAGSHGEEPTREVDSRNELLVDRVRVDDRDLRTGQDERDLLDAIRLEHERVREVVEERDRADRAAVVARERCEQDRGQERAGRGGVARLFEEEAHIGTRPDAERDIFLEEPPQRLVHAGIVDVRAHQCGRAFAVEELVRGLAQEFLVVGEGEVHRRCLIPSGARARAGR